MKKITFLFLAFFLIAFSWQGKAQFVNEGFEGTFPPAGWTVFNNGTGNDWTLNTSVTYANTGTNSAKYAYDSANAADTWLFTGAVTLAAGESVDWSFYTRSRGFVEKLKFTVGTGATVADQTTVLLNILDVDGAYGEQSGVFTATTAGDYYFAFNCYSGANQFELFVDDVLIQTPPTCIAPSDLAVANITLTGVDLSWTDNASASAWEYVVQAAGTGEPVGAGTAVAAVTESVTGLTANTAYEVYVRADCGGGDFSTWIGPMPFVTLPSNDTLATATPITPSAEGTGCGTFTFTAKNVNDGTTDSGMDGTCNGTDTGLDRFYSWTATSPALVWNDGSGNPGIVIRDTSGTEITCSNTFASTDFVLSGWSVGDDLIIQVYDYGTSNVEVTFCLEELSCPAPTNLTPANITATGVDLSWTDNASASAWEYVVQAAGTGEPAGAGTAVTAVTESVAGLTANTAYEVYVRVDCGGGSFSTWTGPVDFTTLVSCPAPTDLTAANISTVGVDLSWTDNASASAWEYVVQAAGTGMPMAAGTSVAVVTESVAGLTANTAYEVYVRADCGGGDFSTWTGPVDFTTLCDVFIPDYTQDFATFTPDCWNQASNGDLASGPTDLGSSSWVAEEFAHGSSSGLGAVNINLYDVGKSDWILSPNFDLSAGGYELKLDVALTNYNNAGADTMGSDDEVQLLYTEDGTTWNNLMTWNAVNQPATAGETITITLPSTGTNVQFGIWATEGTVNDAEDYDFHVDNFIIRTIPACLEPTDLATTNVSMTGVDLSWTDNASASAWEYVVQAAGTGEPMATGTAVAAVTESVTGLTSDTAYEVYVRTDCGGGDFSIWTGPINFTTLISCEAPTGLTTANVSTTGVDLSWTDNASASAWEYVVQAAGTGMPMAAGTSVAAVTESVTGLTADTAYEVYVRADCGGGDFSTWVGPVDFYTGYCQPEVTSGTTTYIDSFSTTNGATNIANATTGFSTDNYGNYYDTMSVSLAPEQSFDFSAEIVGGTAGCAIWVDWNNDLIFDVATENVFENGGYGDGPFTGTITVPPGTANGDYRMRIMIDFNDGVINDDACTFNGTRGEVEDYKITVDNVLSIANANIESFSMYPNPAKDILTLKAQNNIDAVHVYTMLGQEVLRASTRGAQVQLNTSNLPSGTYIIKVKAGEQVGSYKLIKE